MKYNLFSVDDSERNRILFLHEQEKKGSIVSELANSVPQSNSDEDESKTINFNYQFPTGYWSEKSKNLTQKVESELVQPILEFIGKNQGSKVELIVQVGESALKNRDAELADRPYLQVGELAKRRGETIIAILNRSLGKLVGTQIQELPKIMPEVVPPQHKATDPNRVKDQFVRVICRVNNFCFQPFTIKIDYDEVAKQTNRHDCDNAKFKITANGVILKEFRGWEYADLNNGPKALEAKQVSEIGDFRYNSFSIDEELAKQILKADPNKITIVSTCIPEGSGFRQQRGKCHDDLARVTLLRNSDGELLSKPFFPPSATGVICVLDKCGNVFEQTTK